MESDRDVELMLSAYVECALWSSTDEDERPLDDNFGAEDCAEDFIKQAREDCAAFLQAHGADIGDRFEQAGHDFWLTRNRHGAGFWDGDWEAGAGRRLTDAAHVYGSCDLYVGDDGAVHAA